MNCPYKSHGFARNCITSCKPLETIFSFSGLPCGESEFASKNVLGAYVAVKLDDLVRDGNRVTKFLASKARNKVRRILPEKLSRFVTTANHEIAYAEESDVDMEQYLNAVCRMGGQIFNLATPTRSSYDKDFVIEAGMASAKLMVMDDMRKDLSKDRISGRYNPLKDAQTHSEFGRLYVNAKSRLEGIMNRIGIKRTTPIDSFGFSSISSGDWSQCAGAIGECCYQALPKKYQNIIAIICCGFCCSVCIFLIVSWYV